METFLSDFVFTLCRKSFLWYRWFHFRSNIVLGSIFLSLYGYLFFWLLLVTKIEKSPKLLSFNSKNLFWVIGSQFDRYMLDI